MTHEKSPPFATFREELEYAYAMADPEIRGGTRGLEPGERLDILESQTSAILGIFRELCRLGQSEALRALLIHNYLQDEPVNWAALGSCEAEFDIETGWTVITVDGASPEAYRFAGWLEDALESLGWHQIQVVCRW